VVQPPTRNRKAPPEIFDVDVSLQPVNMKTGMPAIAKLGAFAVVGAGLGFTVPPGFRPAVAVEVAFSTDTLPPPARP